MVITVCSKPWVRMGCAAGGGKPDVGGDMPFLFRATPWQDLTNGRFVQKPNTHHGRAFKRHVTTDSSYSV
jgi:hypothetical protein